MTTYRAVHTRYDVFVSKASLRCVRSSIKDHGNRLAERDLVYCTANCATVVQAGAIEPAVAMRHEEWNDNTNKSAAGTQWAIAEAGGNLSVPAVSALLVWRRRRDAAKEANTTRQTSVIACVDSTDCPVP